MDLSIKSSSGNHSLEGYSDFWDKVDREATALLGKGQASKKALDRINNYLERSGYNFKLEANPQAKRSFSIVTTGDIGSEYLIYQIVSSQKNNHPITLSAFRQPVPNPEKMTLAGMLPDSINIGISMQECFLNLEFYVSSECHISDNEINEWLHWIIGQEESLAFIGSTSIKAQPEDPKDFICNAKDFREGYQILKKRLLKTTRIH